MDLPGRRPWTSETSLRGEVNIMYYNLPVREVCRSLENGVVPTESDVKSVHCDTFKGALKEACRLLCTL